MEDIKTILYFFILYEKYKLSTYITVLFINLYVPVNVIRLKEHTIRPIFEFTCKIKITTQFLVYNL